MGATNRWDRWMKWITMQNMNMAKKFIIVFLLLFVVPTFIIGLISYRNYTATIKKTTTEYTAQIFSEMMNKLNGYINDMKSITLIPYYIPDMQKLLQQAGNSPDKSRAIDGYLRLMKRDRKNKGLIYVYDAQGKIFYYGIRTEDIRSDIDSLYKKYKALTEQSKGSPVLLDTQIVTDMGGKQRRFLTVLRNIKDLSDFNTVGIACVDMDIDEMDSMVQQLETSTKGKMYILNERNEVIYDRGRTLLTKKFDDPKVLEMMKGNSGNVLMKRSGESLLTIYKVSQDTGWKFIISIPTKEMYKDAVKTTRFNLMISLLAGGAALAIFILLSYSITKPLRRLVQLMKKVRGGDLDVSFSIRGNDEVGAVGLSFNNMVKNLKALIQEIYVTNLRKKQTELNALQGQINPHFIYNTLETIRMISVLHRVNELSDLTIKFGKLLRYSINEMNELVTIQDEFDHLNNYIYIQNKRFTNKFTLNINVDHSLTMIKTIKLIFQPIVENSIFYGLEHIDDAGVITITAEHVDGYVIFKIIDNGSGIDAEKLTEINRRIEENSSNLQAKGSIGLTNVNERIKLFFGEKYGLTISSELGKGTEVTLRLPFIE
ncbi:cache domain-containing sensor histidine kinase [Cohnella soli]|uniref:histidine kinase n=1 Tax=Cohnella soli TaxID=425005 RepID=A0ABW0HX72_9BACL